MYIIPQIGPAVYTYFIKTDYEALISLFISLAILSSAVSCDFSLKCDTTAYVIPPISISCECDIITLDALCFVAFLFNQFALKHDDFDFDKGRVNRWFKGKDAVSPTITRFYSQDGYAEYLADDIIMSGAVPAPCKHFCGRDN